MSRVRVLARFELRQVAAVGQRLPRDASPACRRDRRRVDVRRRCSSCARPRRGRSARRRTAHRRVAAGSAAGAATLTAYTTPSPARRRATRASIPRQRGQTSRGYQIGCVARRRTTAARSSLLAGRVPERLGGRRHRRFDELQALVRSARFIRVASVPSTTVPIVDSTAAGAVRDRDLRRRRPGARRTRRGAGAPPRRAGTCRTARGACRRARRRSCSSGAIRPGPSLPSSTNAPPSPLAQKPRSSRCSSAVIVKRVVAHQQVDVVGLDAGHRERGRPGHRAGGRREVGHLADHRVVAARSPAPST